MQLSTRARSILGSSILEQAARVAEMRRQGLDVVSLGAGEPDFPTPPVAIAAAREFIEKGRVTYTPAPGLPELREAAAAELSRVTGVTYAAAQTCITCGAKEGLTLALMALVQDPADEVVVPVPSWASYESMVAIAGGRQVAVPTREADGFKLSPEALLRALTPRTRVLLLNSPNNPTGAVYSRAELTALADVLRPTAVAIVSDEIYSPFVFDGAHVSPACLPGMAERTVVISGVSKSHSMTGWRIGFTAGPPDVAAAICNMKSQTTSNAAGPSQVAALAALRSGTAYTETMKAAFRKRLDLACELLAKVPGVSLQQRPGGAFYVFPRIDALYGPGARDSVEFCEGLLARAHLAAVPGAAFGEDRCIRFSIAASEEQIREGLRRFAAFAAALRPAPAAGSAPRR
jgi:aspartate aminotransferase